MEELIKKLYREWRADSYLTEVQYISYVKDTYPILTDRAKLGKTTFYGELPVFGELSERFGNAVPRVIGYIVGACSEHEIQRGHPAISAIVIGQNINEPGQGFFGLSHVPDSICWDTWEGQGLEPPDVVKDEREKFWLSELQKVFDHWKA